MVLELKSKSAQFHFWIACGILLVYQALCIVLVSVILLLCSVLRVLPSWCQRRMQHSRDASIPCGMEKLHAPVN